MPHLMFTKSFTQQEPLPEEAIENAVAILRTGRLFRYNTDGEAGDAALLEQEFAAYMGKKFCLACSSCGSSIYMALKVAGVQKGDTVLCNAFTLAPVPGALENSGAQPVFVEIEENNYTIDLADLERKAAQYKSRYLLLSHMRGHIADMDAVMDICQRHGIVLIEDCAHTMGAHWNNKKSGSFGAIGCFSTQTYKHMNSGEGGLLVTDNEEYMAKAIILSGSYMLYEKHLSRPDATVFDKINLDVPNYSSRMDNLRACLLRVQLRDLETQCQRWKDLYGALAAELGNTPNIVLPKRSPKEDFVPSSLQFSIENSQPHTIRKFLETCEQRGVHIKWFGEPKPIGFTSSYKTWKYLGLNQTLPKTDAILAKLCDIRLPLTFTVQDCTLLGQIIHQTAQEILA